jgi:hypothetical protein
MSNQRLVLVKTAQDTLEFVVRAVLELASDVAQRNSHSTLVQVLGTEATHLVVLCDR